MKQQYIAPKSELTQNEISYVLLEDSLVIDGYYGGEDAVPTDGQW